MKTRFNLEQDIVRVNPTGTLCPFRVRGCYVDLIGDVYYTDSDGALDNLIWVGPDDLFIDAAEALVEQGRRAQAKYFAELEKIRSAVVRYKADTTAQEVQA